MEIDSNQTLTNDENELNNQTNNHTNEKIVVDESHQTVFLEEKNEENVNSTSTKFPKEFKKPSLLIGPRNVKFHKVKKVENTSSLVTSSDTKVVLNNQDTDHEVKEQQNESIKSLKHSSNETKEITIPYKEPSWSGLPENDYKVEVLKSGVILETIDLRNRSFHAVGRLPVCNIVLAHPTISRHHAVFQFKSVTDNYSEKGLYIYDLGSTHGTFLNGNRIRPNMYVRLKDGYMIKFGCSQRKFIIQAPIEDREEESELTVTEIKERRKLELEQRKILESKEDEEGIDWGMGEDADEETDLSENPYATTTNEELFLDDPKKTLRGWFEREGHDLEYQAEEKGNGQFLCWVSLPIDTPTGRPIRAEALVKGKKKEAVIQCAMEACRILDRHGLLRQANHETRKRKTRNWEEEDFYDSDEDNFLDRTGSIEKKREQRMLMAGKLDSKAETYNSLVTKLEEITKKISNLENKLKNSEKTKSINMNDDDEDALDAFMGSLNTNSLTKNDKIKIKLELQNLHKEEAKIIKLVNIAKPAHLPPLIRKTTESHVNNKKCISEDESVSATVQKKQRVQNDVQNKKNNTDTNIDTTLKHETEKTLLIASETNISQVSSEKKDENHAITDEDKKLDDNIGNIECKKIVEKEKPKKRKSQKKKQSEEEINTPYDKNYYDEKYSMWVPAQDQTGDGKTKLNEKYGY